MGGDWGSGVRSSDIKDGGGGGGCWDQIFKSRKQKQICQETIYVQIQVLLLKDHVFISYFSSSSKHSIICT